MDYFSLPLHRTLSTTQESASLKDEEDDHYDDLSSPLSSDSSSSSTTSSQASFYLNSYKSQRQGLYFPPPPPAPAPQARHSPSFGLEIETDKSASSHPINDASSLVSPSSTVSSSLTLADHMDHSAFLSTSPTSSSSSSSYSYSSSSFGPSGLEAQRNLSSTPPPPPSSDTHVHDISPSGPRASLSLANFTLTLPPNRRRNTRNLAATRSPVLVKEEGGEDDVVRGLRVVDLDATYGLALVEKMEHQLKLEMVAEGTLHSV